MHCIALLCIVLHCNGILCAQRGKKNDNSNRENRSDMIQMNNKIVYCMKDHHGVSIKTSRKKPSEDKAMQKKMERERKNVRTKQQGNRVKTEKRQSAQCVCAPVKCYKRQLMHGIKQIPSLPSVATRCTTKRDKRCEHFFCSAICCLLCCYSSIC